MALILLFPPVSVSDNHKLKQKKKPSPAKSSWKLFKSLLTCRIPAATRIDDPAPAPRFCGSSNVVQDTRVIHRSDVDGVPTMSDHLSRSDRHSTVKGGMHLRRLSGCYECQGINIQPLSRSRTQSACSGCGEMFTKLDSLELHQTLRHAVSELRPEDSSRNIVEIIFQSSWPNKGRGICMIHRILKVHNNLGTITSFESYRDAVKSRSATSVAAAASGTDRHHRCAADGNELLRFHCTSLSCSLGARGSTALCLSTAATGGSCQVCTILCHGFVRSQHGQQMNGVRTTASSGRAHECGPPTTVEGPRAMLVCRVIAGRVRRANETVVEESGGGYDSVAGGDTNLEELFVANPRAILPCFVVIYRALHGR